MNIIKVITTKDCYGCKVIEDIIKNNINNNIFKNIDIKIIDYKEDLEFIKNNNISDFPTIVFIKNNNIIASFVGSMSFNNLAKQIKLLF